MTYVKKLVIHGFKSFANKTEILFENDMNVIVGPNGSGKSNITDALCFVLGRLSAKSIRATKAANLIFSGNKEKKPSQEASVELIFDNSQRSFSLDSQEVSIKRIVRKSGGSIYRINNETKTRQELLELLAQTGIDPQGFNIVLQGEIASLVKTTADERRKIIEEVAGISIYESRKQKSLRELEKTDERLKEVAAVLRERRAYLRNLENEKKQAEFYQKLEQTIKKCKATILTKNIKEKEKEISEIIEKIEKETKEITKIKQQISENNQEILEISEEITKINKSVQNSTNNEQNTLHEEISNFKSKDAELKVRKENFESRIQGFEEKQKQNKTKIQELEKEINESKSNTPGKKQQQEELKIHQEKFDELEKDRRKFYLVKSELSTLENRKQEKQNSLIENKKESELIQKNIESLYEEIKFEKSFEKSHALKQKTFHKLEETKQKILELNQENLQIEKQNAVLSQEIKKNKKLKIDIPSLKTCPLCKSKITPEHINEVLTEANLKIQTFEEKEKENQNKKQEIEQETEKLNQLLSKLELILKEIEIDIMKIKNSEEKKQQIKRIFHSNESTKKEIQEIDLKISPLRTEFEKLKNIEEDYDDIRLKLNELSFLDLDIDYDTEVALKQREVSRIKIEQKSFSRDTEESEHELKKINQELETNQKLIDKKEQEEEELYERFQQSYIKRNELQDKQKAVETQVMGLQHTSKSHEDKINIFKIENARVNAEQNSLKQEIKEFENIPILNLPIPEIKERLSKAQFRISQSGSINLKALEVYEKVKEQCFLIEEKVEIIEKEKEQILKIIATIDKTKKKTFMKTLTALNELFTRNFSQLSKKGQVFLDLENKQEPFEGGLNILVKVAKGKYFEVNSLSGGEKTLVALSLIFAIQEYNPYHFYIFDEIDAALDKHNSELLAALIKKYMRTGQYIVITHNDTIINESSTLYGISMQRNISKVISLKI